HYCTNVEPWMPEHFVSFTRPFFTCKNNEAEHYLFYRGIDQPVAQVKGLLVFALTIKKAYTGLKGTKVPYDIIKEIVSAALLFWVCNSKMWAEWWMKNLHVVGLDYYKNGSYGYITEYNFEE
ncbi:hypothetical protein Moror_11251, partial [Moniliophthora roreri MCA 2997]